MATRSPKEKETRRRHDVTIQLRAPSQTRDLIDRAAQAVGKSRSEFMLDSARREAEDVLLDQCFFVLDGKSFSTFMDILDNPPKPNAALKRLLTTKSAWEK